MKVFQSFFAILAFLFVAGCFFWGSPSFAAQCAPPSSCLPAATCALQNGQEQLGATGCGTDTICCKPDDAINCTAPSFCEASATCTSQGGTPVNNSKCSGGSCCTPGSGSSPGGGTGSGPGSGGSPGSGGGTGSGGGGCTTAANGSGVCKNPNLETCIGNTFPALTGCASGEVCCITSNNNGSSGGSVTQGDSGLVPCGWQDDPLAAEDCDFNKFIKLIQNVMNFLLFVVAIPIAAISFAWAGWLYMSAGGNASKVQQAHDIFFSVMLGLAIALAAWLIVYSIVNGLGVAQDFSQFLGQTGGGVR